MKKFTVYPSDYKEPIMSMAQIGRSRDTDKFGYCVYVNPDSGRKGNPYFKFYNASGYNKADKVIRLGIKKFEVIKHSDGFKFWDISKQEAKALDSFLSRKSKMYSQYTNWELMIFLWNVEALFITDAPDEYESNIEAFFDGFYDTKENLAEPSYVPSYQERIVYADMI
ncbi:MAG: hypothetical protein NC320_01800 [Clostridium sp.]|nr:hypothetical protein [Clostridium sp.]